MKSRRNRRQISKTRKQRGGVVFSKIKGSKSLGTESSSSSSSSSSSPSEERIRSNNLNYGAVNEKPVFFTMFIVSPDIGTIHSYGPQYNDFEIELMDQILTLRQKAFPEEYSKKIDPEDIWEAPAHCKLDESSIKNYMYTLFYYTDDAEREYIEERENSKKNFELALLLHHRIIMPTVISNCSLSICDLNKELRIAELAGVATGANYQKQNFGTKLLVGVLNSISDKTLKIDYVWLYYDRTKPHLKDFYGQFGFKEITENETDPELKQIYIGKKYLYKLALNNKKPKFMIHKKEEHKKLTDEELEFVDESNYDDWVKEKKEQIYIDFNPINYETGEPFKNKNGNPKKDTLTKKSIQDFGGDVEKYKQALFDVWIQIPVNKPFIMTKAIKDELNTLTENEKYDALDFERENAQMVLSIADWAYTMNN